ncbi:agmatine deiminase family protein [Sulfuriroseicoccus oceanibius]|uniref:Agmatine deiminase family protein n=1 Tax=Sulfuriroseicoccus oceanibius TaxID=2707525 RepID=A0A6B3KZV4_9BACT|nr:agmatine deiminase family protein [Sulfuriroseicoccus oceanibius]QQL46253.1 agmatine deiminase family protein [Sulfuriroseicoccus oceanibius]
MTTQAESTTPAASGYAMPPEWAAQDAIWLSWPNRDNPHWSATDGADVIQSKFAEIATAISRFQPVRINARPADHEAIRQMLEQTGAVMDRCELFAHPHDDVWCRDHGPIFVVNPKTNSLALTDWGFNGWGEKFTPFDTDDTIPSQIAQSLGLKRYNAGIILEGGSIEINGRGQLLTTEAVLLNPNRNPHLTREQIECKLRDFLGVRDILWLESGIEGDDTDGHIDDLARFTDDRTIVAAVDNDPQSPNHQVLQSNLKRLHSFRNADGNPFRIVEMPQPEACEVPGWRLPVLPASYVNFLILNGAVLMPTFRQPKNDERAQTILAELFPDRQIIPIDCLDLVQEGGALHCISQQQPALG